MFRVIVSLAAVAMLAGCTTHLKPESNLQPGFRTPIQGATVQVVADPTFQSLVIKQRPSFGTSWKAHTFVVPVGRPVMQSIASQTRAIVPAARIGDRDDGMKTDVMVAPRSLTLSFGVDDAKATGLIGALGVLGAGTKAEIIATATLTSEIRSGQSAKAVTVTGESSKTVIYLGISTDDLSKAIGAALDDAAAKLVASVETDLRNSVRP